ncbi:unnamed protein product [Amoebophrya sp. A25]|nr:unnamed protein product [Amoebophrya sp. A25]|eukprot:GSA25T00014376001.1
MRATLENTIEGRSRSSDRSSDEDAGTATRRSDVHVDGRSSSSTLSISSTTTTSHCPRTSTHHEGGDVKLSSASDSDTTTRRAFKLGGGEASTLRAGTTTSTRSTRSVMNEQVGGAESSSRRADGGDQSVVSRRRSGDRALLYQVPTSAADDGQTSTLQNDKDSCTAETGSALEPRGGRGRTKHASKTTSKVTGGGSNSRTLSSAAAKDVGVGARNTYAKVEATQPTDDGIRPSSSANILRLGGTEVKSEAVGDPSRQSIREKRAGSKNIAIEPFPALIEQPTVPMQSQASLSLPSRRLGNEQDCLSGVSRNVDEQEIIDRKVVNVRGRAQRPSLSGRSAACSSSSSAALLYQREQRYLEGVHAMQAEGEGEERYYPEQEETGAGEEGREYAYAEDPHAVQHPTRDEEADVAAVEFHPAPESIEYTPGSPIKARGSGNGSNGSDHMSDGSPGGGNVSESGSVPKKRPSVVSVAMLKMSDSARKSVAQNLTRKKKYGDDLIEWSLNMFHIGGWFRSRCLYTVETPLFDKVILLLILLNSAAMAAYRHREVYNKPMTHKDCISSNGTAYGCGRDEDSLNKMIDIADPIFLLIFIMESLLKIIAYGFCQGKKTYLRDTWNWLDFIVVLTGVISWCLENMGSGDGESNAGSTIKMLRVFRVMRPLRSLTTLPELKVLVNTVLQSIPRLGSVLSMTVFLLVIFGILGLNLWMGVFDRRCRTLGDVRWVTTPHASCPFSADEPGRWEWPLATDDDGPLSRPCGGRYMCEDTIHWQYFGDSVCGSLSVFDLEDGYQPSFPKSVVTAQGSSITFGDKYEAAKFGKWCENSILDSDIPGNYRQLNDANYGFGLTNFNNILNAVIVIFQCITLEGWTDIMYMGQDAHSNDFAFIYFIFLVIIGSFFLLNVALAVVWDAFQELSGENGANDVELDDEGENNEEENEDEGNRDSGKVSPEQDTADDSANDEERKTKRGARRVKSAALLIYEDEKKFKFFFDLASTAFFQNFVMGCIILNIIIMMMDSYPPIKPPLNVVLDHMDTVFSIIFGIEMMIVLLAIGPLNYVKERWHLLDGVIVVVSLIELGEKLSGSGAGGGALKSLRLLRIIKLAKKWASFRLLLQAVIHTVMSMGNFTILLVLMMFVFALMGSLIFANKFKFHPDTDEPIAEDQPCPGSDRHGCVRRAHFDYFLWSIVTVFQCLTGENWNMVMYDGMRGAGFFYFLFFFAMVVLGMCIIFNLFLAILMANFQDASEAIRASEEARKERELMAGEDWEDEEEGMEEGGNGDGEPVQSEAIANAPEDSTQNPAPGGATKNKAGGFIGAYIDRGETVRARVRTPDGSKERPGGAAPDSSDKPGDNSIPTQPPEGVSPFSHVSLDSKGQPRKRGAKRRQVDKSKGTYKDITNEKSVLVRQCVLICQHQIFENFILVMIIVSSMCMAFDDPILNPQHPLQVALQYLNICFTTIFTLEMIMKHVAMGVGNYWSNGWNILDGAVVMVSVIDLVFWIIAESSGEEGGADISFLKTLRILRALRPLRVIARNPNLKLVVNTIFASLPQLRTLMVLMMLFFLIVGLVALNYLKGAFSQCGDFNILELRNQVEKDGGIPTTEMCLYDCAAAETCSQGSRLIKRQGATCPAGMASYRRMLPDHPICIGKCPLDETGSGVCQGYQALDKPTRTENGVTVSDLPNMCAKPGVGSTPDNPINVPAFTADSPLTNRWRSALEYNLMQCTACKERYCPNDEISKQCVDFCEDILLIGNCVESCTSPYTESSPQCVTCRQECAAACSCEDNCEAMHEDAAMCIEEGSSTAGQEYKWVPGISQSFDNIGFAMITLLEISTTEGWVDVMYAAVDARGVHKQPERDHTEIWSLFFVFFMLVGCFLILNLCVGVIVDNFAEMKKAQTNPGSSLLVTPAQQKWINSQKNLATRRMFLSLKNLEHYDKQRRNMFFFVNDDRFEGMIMICIVLNAVIMAMKVYPSEPDGGDFDWVNYEMGLDIVNYIFATIFLVEAILKLYAYRLWYFSDGWNMFDFSCVMATLVGILLDFVFEVKVGALMSSVRLFRIARLLRLLRFAKGLNKIFNAFLLSIPKLFNVACILFLLMFLYAVMGVQMFGKVQFHDTHSERGNFRTFYRAFMTLVRSMTGEAWNELMHELGRGPEAFGRLDGKPCVLDFDVPTQASYDLLDEKCLIDTPIQCGTAGMSYFYWVTYTMFITFVVFNLVVAVILEGFEDSTQKSEDEVVNLAIDSWKKYDPDYKLKLPADRAQDFINELQLEMMEPDERERSKSLDLTDAEKEFLELKVGPDGQLTFVGVVQGALRQIMLFVVESREERAKLMDEIKTVETSLKDPTDARTQLSSNILGTLGYVSNSDPNPPPESGPISN